MNTKKTEIPVLSIANAAGRLIEARMISNMSLVDMRAFLTQLWATLARTTGRAVIFADLRPIEVFRDDVAELLIAMLRQDNMKVERSAYLLGPSCVFQLQVERVIGESGAKAPGRGSAASRRAFRDAAAGLSWIEEILTPEEKARARAFLHECR